MAKKSSDGELYILGMSDGPNRIFGESDGEEILYQEIVKQATGTDITLTDSKRDTGKVVKVEGASSQVVTVQGKNLFDKNNILQLDGVYFSLTNPRITSANDGPKVVYVPCKPNTTYTVSRTILNTDYLRFAVGCTNAIPVLKLGVNQLIQKFTATSITITTDSDAKYLVMFYWNTSYTGTFQEWSNTIQVEQGSTATTYEPFIPNSPSPDYSSPIKSSGDNGLTVWSHGKNWLKNSLTNTTKNGISVTVNSDKSITINGTASAKTAFYLFLNSPIYLMAGTFAFSKGSSSAILQMDLINNGSTTYPLAPNNLTVNAGAYINSLYIIINAGATINNETIYPQLELGVATPYEPYQGSEKAVTLPSGFIGGSLPNGVHDSYELIGGEWKFVQRVGKVVLDGSESWIDFNSNWFNTVRIYTTISNMKNIGNNVGLNLYCDRFKPVNLYGIDIEGIEHIYNQIFIRINKSRLETQDLAGVIAYLKINPVPVYYELAIPIIHNAEDILIDTYPNNTITTLSEVKPNMTISYLEK